MKSAIVLSLSFACATVAFAQSGPQMQVQNLTRQQVQGMIASAKTPAEHERIARYYEAKAQADLALAQTHTRMEAEFKQNVVTSSSKWATGTVNHCAYLAQTYTRDAARMEALAQQHEEMARLAGGK